MISDEFQYVNGPRRLAEMVDAVQRADRVAFDTEFIGETSYEPILCLVQVATTEGIWVVDPLALPNMAEFWQVLTDPAREVVALAAREEIRFCLRYAGRPPARVFDPQLAAGLVGHGYPLSHTNLVRAVLGVTIDGRETFTDWKQRPLSPRQLEYAADDVRYLFAMEDSIRAAAASLNRADWLDLECARLVDRVVEGEREERWWRVSGSGSLGRRELAVLREVWRWRDAAARADNVPPRKVMRDELLSEIAKRRPSSQADLFALRGFDRGVARSAGAEIFRAVQTAMALPNDQLPPLFRRDDPPQVGVLSQLLAVVSNGLAAQHSVDPALLATAADLQELVRWRLGLLGDDSRPAILEGWRGEIMGKPLLDLLEGRRHVRVTDLKSPNPLIVDDLD